MWAARSSLTRPSWLSPTDQRGKRKNNLERGLPRSASSEGVGDGPVGDESSSKVVSHQPWIGEDNPSLTPSGRSTHPGLDAMSA